MCFVIPICVPEMDDSQRVAEAAGDCESEAARRSQRKMEEGARLWCWLVAKSESAAVRSPYAYRYISIKSETQMIRKPQARTVCNNRYRRTARALPVHSTR